MKVRPGICHLSPVVHSTFDPGDHLTSPCWPNLPGGWGEVVVVGGMRLYAVKGLMR